MLRQCDSTVFKSCCRMPSRCLPPALGLPPPWGRGRTSAGPALNKCLPPPLPPPPPPPPSPHPCCCNVAGSPSPSAQETWTGQAKVEYASYPAGMWPESPPVTTIPAVPGPQKTPRPRPQSGPTRSAPRGGGYRGPPPPPARLPRRAPPRRSNDDEGDVFERLSKPKHEPRPKRVMPSGPAEASVPAGRPPVSATAWGKSPRPARRYSLPAKVEAPTPATASQLSPPPTNVTGNGACGSPKRGRSAAAVPRVPRARSQSPGRVLQLSSSTRKAVHPPSPPRFLHGAQLSNATRAPSPQRGAPGQPEYMQPTALHRIRTEGPDAVPPSPRGRATSSAAPAPAPVQRPKADPHWETRLYNDRC